MRRAVACWLEIEHVSKYGESHSEGKCFVKPKESTSAREETRHE